MDRNAIFSCALLLLAVALRKESVDRNLRRITITVDDVTLSLSARRAWIEISLMKYSWNLTRVALRKESVDRNTLMYLLRSGIVGRSPQGERG